MDNTASERRLPPAIRVFLSSTFADMDNERSYFNEVIVPQLNRICAERGVSFFSVDLRWGITEEEQINGRVLPICLGEIDKCRPYFIGILGNRYGSTMEEVPKSLAASIPWLEGKEGKSITELEMLYAVLDREQEAPASHAAFYFRSDELTESLYGHTEPDENLKALKNAIRGDDDLPCSDYGSIEEFGELVMRDILDWCDREFPAPESVSAARREWFNGEILRGYIRAEESHSFLDAYCNESSRALLLYGEGERGKTSLLTAWEPKAGKKILINCGSDDAFRYWPEIAREIITALRDVDNRIFPDKPLRSAIFQGLLQGGADSSGNDFYFTTRDSLEKFRHAFVGWLTELSTAEPVYIVINDLNLLDDQQSLFLSWIPAKTKGSIRFICSTNREDTIKIAEVIGWNCKELPEFDMESAVTYVGSYLNIYGKSLSPSQLSTLCKSHAAKHPGNLRTAADFLINHGRFQSLDAMIADIGRLSSAEELFGYQFSFLTEKADGVIRDTAALVLSLLSDATVSLTEQVIHDMAAAHISFSPIEWSQIRSILEQFRIIKGDFWNITSEPLRAFARGLVSSELRNELYCQLGDYYLSETEADADTHGDTRRHTAYAKAAIKAYTKAESYERLLAALKNEKILTYLSGMEKSTVNSAWLYLFLNSEKDLGAEVYELFSSVCDKYGQDSPITVSAADIFVDFELTDSFGKVRERMGKVPFRGSYIHERIDRIGKECYPILISAMELKNQGNYRELHAYLCEKLEEKQDFNSSELCQLLYYKAICESKFASSAQLLPTANRYFEEAIRAGYPYEFQRAMSILADALLENNRATEAAGLYRQIMELSFGQGFFRSYMRCLNALGICYYTLKKYRDAEALLTKAYELWTKRGDMSEACEVYINLCNCHYVKGDTERAMELGLYLYEKLRGTEGYERQLASLTGNIGLYLYKLDRYAEAIPYLTSAITASEEGDFESTFLKACDTLTKVYTQTGQYMKGFKVSERSMEFLWNKGEYQAIIPIMKEACNLLHLCNHSRHIPVFKQSWQDKFHTVEGGDELFRELSLDISYDSRRIDSLREALAMARSEGKPRAIAMAHRELALALFDTDREAYKEHIYKAADIMLEGGFTDELQDTVTTMLTRCFNEGTADEGELERALSYTEDEAIHRIADLWGKLGAIIRGEVRSYKNEIAEEYLAELSGYSGEMGSLVYECLYDIAEVVTDYTSAETALVCVRALDRELSDMLTSRLSKMYLRNEYNDITSLKSDYLSPEAEGKLAYYDKAAKFLSQVGYSSNTAMLYGNLAIIYRRRKDQDKTFSYHKLSREAYREIGEHRDALIEMLNLSTAYFAFEKTDEAIEVLREGVKEARERGLSDMEAAMAGNLAARLRDRGNPSDHEETVECFRIEEDFYREQGLERDLAISLVNQCAYYIVRMSGGERDLWEPKLVEAGQIIRKNNFQEFYQALSVIESHAKKSAEATAEKKEAAEGSPEEFIKELLEYDGSFAPDRISKDGDMYVADCFPTDSSDNSFKTQIRVGFYPDNDRELVLVLAFLPAGYNQSAESKLRAYLEWSNTLTYYNLELFDRFQVEGSCKIMAADREALKRRLAFYLKLWRGDCASLTLLSYGVGNLSMHQGMKLKIIDEGEG